MDPDGCRDTRSEASDRCRGARSLAGRAARGPQAVSVPQYQAEVIAIAMVVAAACALLGVFLVLRRMALMSDAITHTVLLGIVLAFFVVEDLNSPLLIVGAAVIG